MIGRRFGVHEVEALIGSGGMGEVYRARDTRLGRAVALKVLPPEVAGDAERAARFEREARALASLNHPNIAAIYGVEDRALILELVEGESLSHRLERGRVPAAEAIKIAGQVADALDAAYERGIVHRDLKPSNIMLAATGAVKVLDFGIAKVELRDTDETRQATNEGTVIGTTAYMSPEQTRGQSIDRRTDIWAFGCVL